MSDNNFYFLLKFGEREHLNKMLIHGVLHMKRLRSFQKIEHSEIGDKNEGISHCWQPDQIIVEVGGKKLEGIIGPVKITEEADGNPYVFCMYGITPDHFNKEPGKYIDEKCLEFGDSVLVITNGKEFKRRILESYNKMGGKIKTGAVSYVDHNSYSGKMGAFRKFDYHSHQSEFRIVYQNNSKDDVLNFNIGSIEDIAAIYPSNKINSLIKMENNA